VNTNGRPPVPAEQPAEAEERPRAGHGEPDTKTSGTLGIYAATLRRQWALVALAVIVAGVSGFLVSSARPHTYEATAKVLLGEQGSVDALLGAGGRSPDQERDINTSVQLVGLDSIADRVRRRTGLRVSTASLLRRVTAAIQGNTDILDITARGADPKMAAATANAFAIEYRKFRTQSARATVDQALNEAERRLRHLGPGADRTPFGRRLAAEFNRLQILAAFQTGGVQIVRPATPPASPSGRGGLEAATIAAALGMLLAGGLIVLFARADHRLHDEDDVERAVRLPVLASVPWRPTRLLAGRHAHGERYDDASHEAYGTLAARLGYSRIGMAPRVLLLASAGDGEATPAVTLDLARALRTIGRTVVAVETDLRAPRWADELNLQPSRGLAQLLMLGEETLESAIFDLAGSSAEMPAKCSSTNGGRALVLPAGLRTPQPQRLLAGNGMAGLVHDAWSRADFVLLAAPPFSRESEVLTVAALCDGALIIVRRGRTTEHDARRAKRSLEDIDVRIIGAVVAGAPARTAVLPRPGRPVTRALEHHHSSELQADRVTDGADRETRDERIRAMLTAGTSQAQIARELGITRGRVSRIAKDLREQGLLGPARADAPSAPSTRDGHAPRGKGQR
jgi:polysaccharide biosynthesis transport protein